MRACVYSRLESATPVRRVVLEDLLDFGGRDLRVNPRSDLHRFDIEYAWHWNGAGNWSGQGRAAVTFIRDDDALSVSDATNENEQHE